MFVGDPLTDPPLHVCFAFRYTQILQRYAGVTVEYAYPTADATRT